MNKMQENKNNNVENGEAASQDWSLDSAEMQDLIQQAAEEEANEEESYAKRERLVRQLGKFAVLDEQLNADDQSEVGQFQIPDDGESDDVLDVPPLPDLDTDNEKI